MRKLFSAPLRAWEGAKSYQRAMQSPPLWSTGRQLT
jgi:hypothetical protein